MLISLALLALTLYIFYKWKINPQSQNYWSDKGIPFQESSSSIVTIFQLLTKQKTVIGLDQETYDQFKDQRFGGVVEFGKPSILIKDLDLVKQILIKDFDHFVDRQPQRHQNDPYFDKMLVSLHGQEWKDTRAQLTPTFTSGKIKRMFQHFNKSATSLVKYFAKEQASNGSEEGVIVQDAVGRYLVDVIGATSFGLDTKCLAEKESIFLKMANKIMMDTSTVRILKSLIYLNAPRLAKFLRIELSPRDAMDFLISILSQALQERERGLEDGSTNGGDFLSVILEARRKHKKSAETLEANDDTKSAGLSDELVMAQCLMFFLAGVDTTNALISFALYLMAVHPEIQDKVRAEIDAVMTNVDGTDSETIINYDDITRLEYLDMFISEIQRQYPIATRLKRLCTEDYPIPGSNYVIPKGMSVTIPVQGIHHDEKYYPNPERFDPDRFSSENVINRSQYAQLAFGLGGRSCIGMRFALIESKVAIVHLVRHFIIAPVPATPIPVKIDAKIGLNRPVANLKLKFSSRI